MKKKKALPIILMLVLLAALLISYILLKSYNNKKDSAKEKTEKVIELKSSDIEAIDVENAKGTMHFKYDSGNKAWKNSDDETFPLDTTFIETMLSSACPLNAVRHLDDNLDNIAEYGLDKPSYTLTLKDLDGEDTVLYIGNQTASEGNYYAYLKDSNIVYTIADALPKALDHSINDLVKLDTIPTINGTDIISLDLAGKKFNYFKNGNSQYYYTNSNDWFLANNDGSYTVVDTTAMESITSTLIGLSFNSCVNYNVPADQLSQYGLTDDNAKKIVIDYYTSSDNKEKSQITIYIGNQNESGEYYVRTSLSASVNLVAADTVTAIFKDSDVDLTNKNAFAINASLVKSLKAETNGKSIEIMKDGKVTDKKYENIYNSINTITSGKVIEDAASISSDAPSLTVEYSIDSQYFPTVKMQYTKYNGSYYQVTINGDTKLLVEKTTIDNIVSALEQIN